MQKCKMREGAWNNSERNHSEKLFPKNLKGITQKGKTQKDVLSQLESIRKERLRKTFGPNQNDSERKYTEIHSQYSGWAKSVLESFLSESFFSE